MLKKILLISPLVTMLLCGTAKAGAENPRFNSIRVMPVTVYGKMNIGLGISYERQIIKNGKVGLNFPVYGGFKQMSSFGRESSEYLENGAVSVLFNPGIKFYLIDKTKIALAVGPSYFAMIGNGTHIQKAGPTWPYKESRINFRQNGLLANVHLRLNANPKFFVGFDVGLGPGFVTRYRENDQLVSTDETKEFLLFNFNLGFRF